MAAVEAKRRIICKETEARALVIVTKNIEVKYLRGFMF